MKKTMLTMLCCISAAGSVLASEDWALPHSADKAKEWMIQEFFSEEAKASLRELIREAQSLP